MFAKTHTHWRHEREWAACAVLVLLKILKITLLFVWGGQQNAMFLLETWQGADNVMTLY